MSRLGEGQAVLRYLREIFELMEARGITITVDSYDTNIEYEGVTYRLKDIDSRTFPMNTLPPTTEYCIFHTQELGRGEE